MKVVVCGAGQVGFNIARYLAGENNDVTVIDSAPQLTRKIGDTLDVQAVTGYASRPDVLERAGAGDADLIVAVTYADEVNMVACQVAHSLFNVPTKIARVRDQSYLLPVYGDLFSRDHMPIDHIISPEIEVARNIARRLHVPGAFDMIPIADGRVRVIGVHCDEHCPVLNTPLRQLTGLFPDLNITVAAITRDGRHFIPVADDQMISGDDVYFFADENHLPRAMSVFGHEEKEARRIIIVGGGNIGLRLAQDIEAEETGVSQKVIELDHARAEEIAGALQQGTVINGDSLDPEILEEANVTLAETIVAVTNDDEVNILTSMLAKRFGCQRSVTLINKTTYQPLIPALGIDAVVSPRGITISTILQHVRRGRIKAVHSLQEGFGEVIEAQALETSPLVGKPLQEANLPQGVIIGAVVRGSEVVIPRPSTEIKPEDRVCLLAATDVVKQIERMFSVRLEFF